MTKATPPIRTCKDCGSTKAVNFQGPRDSKCWRKFQKATKERAHDRRVCETYGLKPGEYAKLLEAQGGACAGCGKKFSYYLDVDHDHVSGVVRGLLCKSDNRKVLPYAKDDAARLRRLARYLEDPPAVKILGIRKAK